jgi:hypothetical protein
MLGRSRQGEAVAMGAEVQGQRVKDCRAADWVELRMSPPREVPREGIVRRRTRARPRSYREELIRPRQDSVSEPSESEGKDRAVVT